MAFSSGGAAKAGVRGGEVLVPLWRRRCERWREGGDPAGGAGAGWLWLLLPPYVAGGRRAVQFAHSKLLASPSLPRVSGAMAFAETNPAASSLPNGDCGRPRARPGGNRVTVLGARGDEGKGKVVDLLAQDADIACRCQVRRQGSDLEAGPLARAQNSHPPSEIRCHLEVLSLLLRAAATWRNGGKVGDP